MILELFCILVLTVPMAYELWHDHNGDKHPNVDWKLRGLLMLLCAGIVAIINERVNFIQAFVMTLGIFTLFFPYLINIIQYNATKDRSWWNHLSKSAWPDKVEAWSGLDWPVRMFILLTLFSACVKLYLCWGKFLSFYNEC